MTNIQTTPAQQNRQTQLINKKEAIDACIERIATLISSHLIHGVNKVPHLGTCNNPWSKVKLKNKTDLALHYLARNLKDKAHEIFKDIARNGTSSLDYAYLPHSYSRMGREDQATICRLYLTIYQLQEGKTKDALDTFERLEQLKLTVKPLYAALKLLADPMNEHKDYALKVALGRPNVDKIFIFRQLLAQDPFQLDVYESWFDLGLTREEKKAILLEAEGIANWERRLDIDKQFKEMERNL